MRGVERATRATPRAPARVHVRSGYELGPEPFPRKHALFTLCLGSPGTRAGGARGVPTRAPAEHPSPRAVSSPASRDSWPGRQPRAPVTHPGGSGPKQLLPAPEGPAARAAPAARSPPGPPGPPSPHTGPAPRMASSPTLPHVAIASRGAAQGGPGAPGGCAARPPALLSAPLGLPHRHPPGTSRSPGQQCRAGLVVTLHCSLRRDRPASSSSLPLPGAVCSFPSARHPSTSSLLGPCPPSLSPQHPWPCPTLTVLLRRTLWSPHPGPGTAACHVGDPGAPIC